MKFFKKLRLGFYILGLAAAIIAYALSLNKKIDYSRDISYQIDSPVILQSGSLKVERDMLVDVFKKSPFNFYFDYVPLTDGRSRLVGRSADNGSLIELIGPSDGLLAATYTALLSDKKPLAKLRNLNGISAFIDIIFSDWEGRHEWLGENIDGAFSGVNAGKTFNRKTITLSKVLGSETLILMVFGPPV
jgi:hypothetical protein